MLLNPTDLFHADLVTIVMEPTPIQLVGMPVFGGVIPDYLPREHTEHAFDVAIQRTGELDALLTLNGVTYEFYESPHLLFGGNMQADLPGGKLALLDPTPNWRGYDYSLYWNGWKAYLRSGDVVRV